jgi:tRNA 2-thiouridine synthesizing protein A
LELEGVGCPDNYIQATLAMEELEVGQILAVVLHGQDSIANVSRSFKQAGQKIVAVDRQSGEQVKLWIQKVH